MKNNHNHNKMINDFKKRFLISLVLTIPVLLLSPTIQQVINIKFESRYALFLLSTIIFIYGGKPFLKGFYNELKKKKPGMMTLISVAIITAYTYSSLIVFGLKGKMFYWELVTLIDIMLLGHWIEMKSIMSASMALEKLAKLIPSEAHKIINENIINVPIKELRVKDKILIKPGERIPIDGIIINGETTINESMITGESKPIHKKKGDKVIGGSINNEGSIIVIVEKTGDKTFLSQIINLVKKAQQSKSRTQNLADKAAVILTIIALTSGVITFTVWKAVMNYDIPFALERTVTVMIITCPHALGLAVPLVISVSTAIAARKGFIIRNRTAFEKARKINTIIFDKTGTLTKGEFGVTNIITLSKDFSKKQVLSYASALESHSEHPIAKAIINSSRTKLKVKHFKSIPGKGVSGVINNKKVKIVSSEHLKNYKNKEINKLLTEGKTVIFVMINNKVVGAIALSDIIRKESIKAVKQLKKMGINCVMITGDNENVAANISKKIGLNKYFANVLPSNKLKKIKELKKKGAITAMIGDGINDAPALTEADVGIAIGAGTDIAIESADIILVRNDLRDVVSIINLSRKTYNKMIQNLAWATGYNAITIPLAAGILYNIGVLLSPAIGALLMSLSTIIVAINAKLLRG